MVGRMCVEVNWAGGRCRRELEVGCRVRPASVRDAAVAVYVGGVTIVGLEM